MVAMPAIDLIVAAVWVGALCIVMLAQAALLYVRHRFATKQAQGADRLATAIAFPQGGRDALGRQAVTNPAARSKTDPNPSEADAR
jgi:hypothetical protein